MKSNPQFDYYDWIHDYSVIPEHIIDALERYTEKGISPGHFLTAVIEGDLFEAIGRADNENMRILVQIACYVYNNVKAPTRYKGCVAFWGKEQSRLREEKNV